MLKLLSLLLLAPAACTTPPPDYVTQRGVEVYAHGFAIDPATLDAMDARLEPVLPNCDLTALVVGFFTEEQVTARAAANGVTANMGVLLNNVLLLTWRKDLWSTAYVHEQAHWCLMKGTGDYDSEHLMKDVWDLADRRGP